MLTMVIGFAMVLVALILLLSYIPFGTQYIMVAALFMVGFACVFGGGTEDNDSGSDDNA